MKGNPPLRRPRIRQPPATMEAQVLLAYLCVVDTLVLALVSYAAVRSRRVWGDVAAEA